MSGSKKRKVSVAASGLESRNQLGIAPKRIVVLNEQNERVNHELSARLQRIKLFSPQLSRLSEGVFDAKFLLFYPRPLAGERRVKEANFLPC